MVCNLNVHVSWYMRESHIEVLVCIRCNEHFVKAKLEVNSSTHSEGSCSVFNSSIVRWIRSDIFKSCLNLVFTLCRFLHQELRDVIENSLLSLCK